MISRRIGPSRLGAVRSLHTSAYMASKCGERAGRWLWRVLDGQGTRSLLAAGTITAADLERIAFAVWRHRDEAIATAGIVVPEPP